VEVSVAVARVAAMAVLALFDPHRHGDQLAIAHAALGDDVVGEMLHIGSLAAQHSDLHAAVVVEMDMHRGQRQIVMLVEGAGEALR
jgi:hypothetical protein